MTRASAEAGPGRDTGSRNAAFDGHRTPRSPNYSRLDGVRGRTRGRPLHRSENGLHVFRAALGIALGLRDLEPALPATVVVPGAVPLAGDIARGLARTLVHTVAAHLLVRIRGGIGGRSVTRGVGGRRGVGRGRRGGGLVLA